MLNLKLRDEFLGSQMPDTAIELRRSDNKGAAQRDAEYILSITYPTTDVQTALRQISSVRAKRPIVLMGDRGRGKSHIMAVLHHAVQSSDQVEQWAKSWGTGLDLPALMDLALEQGFIPISEAVHNNEYPLLWNLLFDRHPKGEYYRGQFESLKQHMPPRSLLEKMFEEQPTVLVLDEFQKWFDGLPTRNRETGGNPQEAASNFIQVLSELACDRPEILVLVVSVLNNSTDAFRQVHRNDPVVVDFRGPTAKQDRQRLVLHRLFENRTNIPANDIENLVSPYAGERYRLRFSHLTEAERERINQEAIRSWPFSPELLSLLEEQILMAAAAQETRDLIRILAHVYRARGKSTPIITPADFFVDDDSCGVQSLLDSIATVGEQEKLREVAQSNLQIIQESGEDVPHARELVSSLWMRSMSPGRTVGGTRQELQLDITKQASIDDNAFQAELNRLIENSKNIHGEESPEGRLHFEIGENPRSLVRATARNEKLWQPGAMASTAGEMTYPGKDIEHIRNTLKHLLVPEARQPASRVIVLGPKWNEDPWSEVDEIDHPGRWDRPVLLGMPSPIATSGADQLQGLGDWLAKHVPSKRNMVRFLLLKQDAAGIYDDPELRFLARCSFLTSIAWHSDPKYRALKSDFDNPLRGRLKTDFDRFAVLKRWNYQDPPACGFHVERIGAQGSDIPDKVEEILHRDLFDPAEFMNLVKDYAKDSAIVGDLLDELAEAPGSPEKEAMIYLGQTQLYEEILKVAARGEIVLNVDGAWVGKQPDQEYEEALRAIRGRAFRSGQDVRNVQLALPGATGGSTVTGPATGAGAQQPTPGGAPVTKPGGLFPGSESGGTTAPPATGGSVVTPPPSGQPATPPAVTRYQASQEPQIGINLCGSFEQWGLDNSDTLRSAKIEFQGLSVQQIKQILQRLPSAFRVFDRLLIPGRELSAAIFAELDATLAHRLGLSVPLVDRTAAAIRALRGSSSCHVDHLTGHARGLCI